MSGDDFVSFNSGEFIDVSSFADAIAFCDDEQQENYETTESESINAVVNECDADYPCVLV